MGHHFLLFDFDHGLLLPPGLLHGPDSIVGLDEVFGEAFLFEQQFLGVLEPVHSVVWEEGFWLFELCNDLDQEFLFVDEFLDDGVVDFVFF